MGFKVASRVDDAYLGGVRSCGKRGRGAAGKTPFVAAVSTSPEGRPRKLKLAPVRTSASARSRAVPSSGWPRRGGCDGRPGLLERTRRSRLQPSGDPYRAGPTGSPHGALQMGEHDARQHQERDHRDLSQARPRPC